MNRFLGTTPKRRLWAFGVGVLLFLYSPLFSHGMENFVPRTQPASGHPVSIQGITPADVFARVQWLRKELDEVRFEMGRPKSQEVGLIIEQAAPHEVFFQAKILYKKINRLSHELTGELEIPLSLKDPETIKPFHVWSVVDQTLRRLLHLKKKLDISTLNSEAVPEPSTTPTQVFFVIGFASQQLNHLLSHQFSPKNVMAQVLLGSAYTSQLLTRFANYQEQIPRPRRERGRKPSDVYDRLAECYFLLGEVAKNSRVKMLRLSIKNLDRIHVHPNDVYDLASLLVSELIYLSKHTQSVEKPNPLKPAGPILPSHVYQQAGILYSQLKELHKHVQANPGWLK